MPSLGSSAFNPGLVSYPCSGSFSGSSSLQRSSARSSRGSHTSHLHHEKKDNLCFLVINTNSVKGKAAELAHICDYKRPNILVMSETKLDKSVCSAEFLPKNYFAVWEDRTLHSGGVIIATRRGLIVDEISLKGVKKSCELVFVRVTLADGAPPLFVGAYYRSQIDNSSNESLDGLEAALQQVSTLVGNSNATVILAGDFNCKDICWDTHSNLPGNPNPSVWQDTLLDLFTSNESLVSSIDTILDISTASKPDAIVVDMSLRAQHTQASPHKIHLWSKVQWPTIKEETSAFSTRFCAESLDKPVDEQWDLIKSYISKMIDKHVPTKTSKARFDQPWLTTDLKRKCLKKQRLYNKWKNLKPEGNHMPQPEMPIRNSTTTQVTSYNKLGWGISTRSWVSV